MNTPMPELPFRDIHLPPSISWWPLAFGWWVMISIVIAILVVIFILVRNYLKSSLKKDAAKELNSIEQMYLQTQDSTRCVSALSILLRRVILSQKQQVSAAGITGHAWLQLLDQYSGTCEFSQGPGKILLVGPYQPTVEKDDVDQLIQLCRKWVNRL